MTDEPTLGELKRAMETGFASVNASLSKVVTQEAFLAEQRRIEERFGVHQAAIAEEKAERVAAFKDEKAEREKAVLAERTARETAMTKEEGARKSIGTWVRFTAASIAIPVVLYLVDFVQGKPGS